MEAAELRQEPEQELRERAKKLREEIFNLRFKATTEPVTNPAKVRDMKRDVARIETVLRERELASKPRPKKLTRRARKLAAARKANAAAIAAKRERKKAAQAGLAAKRAKARGKGGGKTAGAKAGAKK
jgi:large subunit ribosomal protein L29